MGGGDGELGLAARYDDDHQPPPDQAHWFPRRETMPPEERDAAILARIRQVMAWAHQSSPFYRRKWDEAGVHPPPSSP